MKCYLYHTTDFESMQSIIRDGILKVGSSGELCFSVNSPLDCYGEYCVKFKSKVNLSSKRNKWIIGGRGSQGEIVKVATKQNISIIRFNFYKVDGMKRINNPFKFFNVEKPDVDYFIEKLKVEQEMELYGFEVYYDSPEKVILDVYDVEEEKPKNIVIDLLEGIPVAVQSIIKRFVGQGASPLGFTYYIEEDALYYFNSRVS